MRSYPHQPDPAFIQKLADDLRPLFYPFDGMTPAMLEGRSAGIWASNAETGLDLARYGYALGESVETVHWYLGESNQCFVAGMSRAAPFDLMDLLQQLYVAIVRGDLALAGTLSALDAERYAVAGVTPPDAAQDEYDFFAILLSGGRDTASTRLTEAQVKLEAKRMPRVPKAEWTTAFDILGATRHRDAAALTTAFAQRATAFAHRFSNPVERENATSLLDLHGLALASIARRSGLPVPDDNVYIPLSLLVD